MFRNPSLETGDLIPPIVAEPRAPLLVLLQRFKTNWRLLVPVLFPAALGIGYGWYFYYDVGQFRPSSEHFVNVAWWPLVSDSPNAVLVWVVAVLAYMLFNWRHWLLDALAFCLNIYVGLWTTFLFVAYSDRMGTFDWASVADGNANPVLFVSHMGMPLLGLVMVPDLLRDARKWTWLAGTLAFLAAFVAVDYWGPHLHPAPFLHSGGGDATLHAGAPWLMVVPAVGLAWIWWAARAKAQTLEGTE